ncbi:PAS domain-containing protein [Rubellimicrobium roseum]|uniref:histidine kinase n=1 Tax=Rubellimicrobium roseum TaxID=687525 RepID=A0A5C4N3T4_9RHOB|nr:PAS domain-containing protein [Rubellimicrobium roseum]TNC61179.1 PAS domain S-box protein [Rubellimicrobium roseum]
MLTELLQLVGRSGLVRRLEPSTRTILDALPYPAFVTDADGTTLYSNQPYQAYTGLPADALRGNAWAALIHPEDCEQAAASWISALHLGAALEVEYRFRRADGEARWFRRRAAPQLDDKGQIRYWFGTLEDIHDKKMAEVAARAAQTGLPDGGVRPRLAQQFPEFGTFEWDPITEELYWSAQCRAAFGLPSDEEETDEVFQSRLHPEDRSAVLERIDRALDPSGPGRYSSQYRVLWPDSTVHWMRAKGTVTFEEVAGLHRAVHFGGIVLDITQARRTEGTLTDAVHQGAHQG